MSYGIVESIPTFRIGDEPLNALTFGIQDADGAEVDLTTVTTVTVTLTSPAAVVTDLQATVANDKIAATWPEASPFDTAGLYVLNVTLSTATGSVAVEPERIVVQGVDGWNTLADARDGWADAPSNDVQLYRVLETAKAACLAYAPALVDGAAIPLGYVQAQIMQARNTWNASKSDPAQTPDGEMFIIRPYPLDNHIKDLLRPRRAVPVIV